MGGPEQGMDDSMGGRGRGSLQRAWCTGGIQRSSRATTTERGGSLLRSSLRERWWCSVARTLCGMCVYMCTVGALSRRVSTAQRTQRSHPPVRPHSPRPRAPTQTPASSCASAGWQMGLGMPYGTYRTEGTYRACVRGVWGALYPQVEYPVSRLVRASSDLITVMPSQRLRCRRYLLGGVALIRAWD